MGTHPRTPRRAARDRNRATDPAGSQAIVPPRAARHDPAEAARLCRRLPGDRPRGGQAGTDARDAPRPRRRRGRAQPADAAGRARACRVRPDPAGNRGDLRSAARKSLQRVRS